MALPLSRRWAKLKNSVSLASARFASGHSLQRRFSLGSYSPEARRFPGVLHRWLKSLRATAEVANEVDKPIFAIDGKNVTPQSRSSEKVWARCTASAFGPSDFGLSLGQVACAEKSNESRQFLSFLRFGGHQGHDYHDRCDGTQKAIAARLSMAKPTLCWR